MSTKRYDFRWTKTDLEHTLLFCTQIVFDLWYNNPIDLNNTTNLIKYIILKTLREFWSDIWLINKAHLNNTSLTNSTSPPQFELSCISQRIGTEQIKETWYLHCSLLTYIVHRETWFTRSGRSSATIIIYIFTSFLISSLTSSLTLNLQPHF